MAARDGKSPARLEDLLRSTVPLEARVGALQEVVFAIGNHLHLSFNGKSVKHFYADQMNELLSDILRGLEDITPATAARLQDALNPLQSELRQKGDAGDGKTPTGP
jgi:hypothetical protein